MKAYKTIRRITALALAVCAALLTGCTGITPAPQQGNKTGFAIFTAERKAQPKDQEAQFQYQQERIEAGRKAPDIRRFTQGLYAQLIAENGGNNLVCSPVSVYIALAMLAEVTGGDTRAEILTALGAEDIASLREGVAAFLKAETVDDGSTTSLIGNSVWLNEELKYKEEPLKTLAEIYGASSFSGDPNDEAFKKALRSWLNENTGGLLKDEVKGIEPGTVLTLASTIYFKAAWEEEFPKGLTKNDVFHAASGDVKVPFMHNTITGGEAFRGEGFTAMPLGLRAGGGAMWLFLPDEGVSVNDITEGALGFIFSGMEGTEYGFLIKLSLPKFDVASGELDLIPAVMNMGVTQCFTAPDFTPMLEENQDAVVSRISHAARVKIDEEGLEAAAYTVITADGAMFTEKELEIVFDRPFMFVITGTSGAPLFIGTVNTL